QSGTSHNLGQNFAKAFDIKYLDPNNELQYCWTTSWGLSTRMIGAVVMAHGDDKGLRLPPKLAPYQVVIIPIFKNDDEQSRVMEAVARLKRELIAAGIRIHVDTRDGVTPGFKFNDWEMHGVPVRMEVGPKDVDKGTVALARRDILGKEGKQFVPQENIAAQVNDLLTEVQANMLAQATTFREANTHDVRSYDELRQVIEAGGWARGWWAGSGDDEVKIKDDLATTIRCFPFDQPGGQGTCLYTGKPAERIAIFARAY
ncbi:MAG: proline--tRNA ligase, partial [Anaerolineae bacterium]|nr:proline--tRNA ligase [Anaerolineae bacterium]